MTEKNRIYSMDFLKYICTFLVICIHNSFPGELGKITVSLFRIAVPIFFMITGYFYSNVVKKEKSQKQIYKILKLFIFSNLLYFAYGIFRVLIKGGSLILYLKNIFNLKTIFDFMVLNESPFCIHLWYLGAILYVLVFVHFFEKKYDRTKLYPLIPILLIGNLVIGSYSSVIFGQSIPYFWSRNFLFLGLPYFLIGDILNKHNLKIKNKYTIILFILTLLTTILEKLILSKMGTKILGENYISTIFSAILLFQITINNEYLFKNSFCKFISKLGLKFSTTIYIIHPLIIVFSNTLFICFIKFFKGINIIYPYLAPFIILIISTIISFLISKVNCKIKHIK